MNGVLLINKEANMTSRDVVNEISHLFSTKKVGHTGTLDPMALGVLVVCLGSYTKLGPLLTSMEKEYLATMKLGILTDTLDITGHILERKEVKINEYARENIEVELPKREVEIKELELIKIENDTITFRALVSKGTYIRSLIRDIANNLNTIGVMSSLTRIKQGNFKIEDCHKLKDVNEKMLLTIEDLFDYPIVNIDEQDLKKVMNGNLLKLNCNEPLIFVSYNNEKKAIYQKDGKYYKIIFKV